MKKHIAVSYVVLFVLLFIVPVCVYELFGNYFDQTNYEQRQAAEKPVFSIDTIQTYPAAFEAYYNDSLPFRNQMIRTNSLLNWHLFKRSAVGKVVVGKDDWLFYNPAGKDGDPIADYQGTSLLTQEQLEMFGANLISARNTLQAQGKEFVVLIVPNKESMYGNAFLPDRFVTENSHTKADQVAQYLTEHTDLTVVYPKKSILTSMENDPDHIYYYKTDTHWNDLGAYVATADLLNHVGISIPALEELELVKGESHAGDLAGMLGLADYLKYDNLYSLNDYCKGQNVEKVYPIQGSTNLCCTSTSTANDQSLFMIRDSFAITMIPYLSTQFDECCFVHIDTYTPSMLQQYPSDIVVLEVAERYIWNLLNFKAE